MPILRSFVRFVLYVAVAALYSSSALAQPKPLYQKNQELPPKGYKQQGARKQPHPASWFGSERPPNLPKDMDSLESGRIHPGGDTAEYLIRTNQLEKAIHYGLEELSSSEKTGDIRREGQAYVTLATAYGLQDYTVMAMHYINKFQELDVKDRDLNLGISKVLNKLGIELLDFKTVQKLLVILEELHNQDLSDQDHHLTSLALAQTYLNLAYINRHQNKPDESDSLLAIGKNYLSYSIQEDPLRPVKAPMFYLKGFLGVGKIRADYARFEGDFELALQLHKQELRKVRRVNHKSALVRIHMHLGEDYYHLFQFDDALLHLNVSQAIVGKSIDNKTGSLRLGIMDLLARVHHSLGNKDSALYYYHEVNRLNKLKARQKSSQSAQELRIKYETEKSEEELFRQKTANSRQKQTIYFLLALVILVTLIIVILYRTYLQKKKANLELLAKNQKISDQADELENLSKFKEGLSAMIVHDLKNPLNAIINYADEKPSKELMLRVKNSGKRMLHMVLNILDIQKFEETKVISTLQPHNLLQLIETSIDEVRYLSDRQNISIKIMGNENYEVNIDTDLTQRVLVNILSNAIKYSDLNSQVKISSKKKGEKMVLITVVDQGQGIPKDELPNVFKKFWQLNSRKLGDVRSVGLGLTFCKMAIESQGGNIWMDSELGYGTTVYFTLPLLQQLSSERSKVQQQARYDFDQKTISYLKVFTERLSQYEIHQMSELLGTINEIEEGVNPGIAEWKAKIENAILASNQDHLYELIQL